MNDGGQEKGRREAVEADEDLQQLQYQPTDRQTQLEQGDRNRSWRDLRVFPLAVPCAAPPTAKNGF